MDETWIDHYTTETKYIQSKVPVGRREHLPMKAKTVQPVGKAMTSVFLNAKFLTTAKYKESEANIIQHFSNS